ncbi:LuxR family transcriptional regulator [Microbacterium sp. dk485]|uniref:helix-turn-helix transcriptional regulator n=1 Tax=Microbacterium TaxID=33882 RepID=UPI001073125B|nr:MULTISPECIES: LuxR C-terminal-related transcriptional regulator [Microbacterium]TFV81632.1 LuxR family transcriptional regulator [Microbacterium sp. dk485]TXK10976.1 LuxR family transcriptional regulator [Microbacterium wangchenii]
MARPDLRSAVTDSVSEAVQSRTSVVAVGLPGSGRRWLLARVRERFERREWSVIEVPGVRGRPLESLALAGIAASTIPGAGPLAGLAATVQALSARAATGPALLLLEDADLLDETSAGVIAAALSQHDITAVATVRPPFPGASALDVLTGRVETTALWLPTLPFEDVHHLVADALGGDVQTDAAGRIYALSGGLPGIARSIAVEARREGRLVFDGSSWSAGEDLWTPALAVVVGRLTQGLTDEEKDALRVLAEAGPTDVESVRDVVPWHVATSLDDRGLFRFVQEEDRMLGALFPPLLEDHLRHDPHGVRRRRAAEVAAAALRRSAPGPHDLPARPLVRRPLRWSSSPEAAAILGRVLRENTAARVARCRTEWETDPTDATAVLYVHALLDHAAPPDEIERVLAAARAHPSELDMVRLAGWEAMYRALVAGDVGAGAAVLARAEQAVPRAGAVLAAIGQHIGLIAGAGQAAVLPALPEPGPAAATGEGDALGLPALTAVDVIRMVRGEILLAGGRVDDAAAEFSGVSPTDPTRYDPDALVPLGQLCAGDIDGAIGRAARQLDIARGTLDRALIEPHGYVLALGLLLQGRLSSLRAQLTGLFAINAPAPLRPASRAGLLTLAALLSLLERNHRSARSMIAQLEGAAGGPFPLTAAEPASAALAVAEGQPAVAATQRAWRRVETLIDEGHFLAAAFDGAWLIDLHVDDERAARLIQVAGAGQGLILPAIAEYLESAAARSPRGLLRSGDLLRSRGLVLHATRARARAIELLREAGDAEAAASASADLRRLVRDYGDDLRLLAPDVLAPEAQLTARELEVARLIVEGLSNREVSRRLVVSERTVDNHVYRIFRKLGITSRDELASLL